MMLTIFFRRYAFPAVVLAVCLVPVMISVQTGFCAETMSVDEVLTTDPGGTATTVFEPGDDMRVKVDFSVDGRMTAVFLWGEISATNFQETLPAEYAFLPAGSYTTTWDVSIPANASGTATARISFVGIIDAISTREATFSITEATPDEPPVAVGSETCKLCHADIAEDLQDSLHVFIDCENCHGPGSNHVGSPSKDNIIVDTSAELCGRCHTRGDSQNRVEAEDGLIKHNQQFDELLTGGKAAFKCVRCHNPHVSVQNNPQDAIIIDCTTCHTETINQFHIAAGVDCIDCHMPLAVKKQTSTGAGDNLKGDTRAHLYSVDTAAEPAAMFFQEDGKTYTNGFLTLNFTCLGCHDGSFGRAHDFDWAVQAATLIHAD